jgi:hypothetical protein
MARRDPRVTEYINGRAPFARPVLRHLRKAIHACDPSLEEDIKWGMPSFLYHGRIVCGIAGFKAHCALWFWKGTTIVGRKPTEAMGNFGRLTSLEDLPSATELKGYVRKAMRRIDEAARPSAAAR